ncbi:hypothetical protein J6590_088901 [Homalodisca vitripennis]|nr:hypothetical protein J6590_088901 [Homalodisca vitripennis]
MSNVQNLRPSALVKKHLKANLKHSPGVIFRISVGKGVGAASCRHPMKRNSGSISQSRHFGVRLDYLCSKSGGWNTADKLRESWESIRVVGEVTEGLCYPEKQSGVTLALFNNHILVILKYAVTRLHQHKNLEVVDFNHINRRLFTSHGMHLRTPGKRLFAILIIKALLMINIPVCDPSSAIMASPADKSPSTTEPVAAAEPEHDAGLSSAAGPPSATEPRDDPPEPTELHLKPTAAGLTDDADPISSVELSSVFGPPLENVPRVCPGTDSYADALRMKKEDELTIHRPNLFLEVPVDAYRLQHR